MDPIFFIPVNVASNLDWEKFEKDTDTDTDIEEAVVVMVEPQLHYPPLHYQPAPVPTCVWVFMASPLIIVMLLFLASLWSFLAGNKP